MELPGPREFSIVVTDSIAHRLSKTARLSHFLLITPADSITAAIANSSPNSGSGTDAIPTARLDTCSGNGSGWFTSSLSPELRRTSLTAINEVYAVNRL